ncbi:Hypothetical_protein [Hexamita inflata]|nr:Hypothetical protein HINF_LOCUS9519 [Hexamita inflata]CAI9964592.1 Hypothetical protein HINF_LOCUS52237 [Hexamita inflata]
MQCIIYGTSLYSYHNHNWSLAGGIIGDSHITPLSIQQTIVNKSDIQAYGPVTKVVAASGLVSLLYNQNNICLSNINVCNSYLKASSNISQYSSCSGVFSHVVEIDAQSSVSLSLNNTILSNITLIVNGRTIISGIILSNNKILEFFATQVSTDGNNTINSVVVPNCASIINPSQRGC